jgi:hypothetical protein
VIDITVSTKSVFFLNLDFEVFEYLGTIVTADGKIDEEINHSKYHSRKQGTKRGYKNEDM